jgi:hypothetical protein
MADAVEQRLAIIGGSIVKAVERLAERLRALE